LPEAAIDAERSPSRIVAVDWSGDKTGCGQRKKIWVADWHGGGVSLSSGRTREETADYLVAAARETPEMVVGLDFAFSYPAWFVREQGCVSVEEFWELVAGGRGEDWLSTANDFCWGRKGVRRPNGHGAPEWLGFRRTDCEISVGGIQPKSPFQIGGAGAVGTGSLRGIPILHRLRQEGFSIWPFMAPDFPIALEIYPRWFTGDGNKSGKAFRSSHLGGEQFASLPRELIARAESSEDAFDALCSVMGMKDHIRQLGRLTQASDARGKLEGRIWLPASD